MKALVVLAFAGCSNSPAGTVDASGTDSGPDAPTASLTLTSPVLANGGAFDPANTCDGVDTSPQLVWSGAPSATRSFAIVMIDQSLSPNLVHWVIYDVPATSAGLPADVDKAYQPVNVAGAHQTESYQPTARGYLGPCPPAVHTYQLTAYALDVEVLPGTSMATTRAQVIALLAPHQLATGVLTGTYHH